MARSRATETERKIQARLAAYESWAQTRDRKARTAKAQQASMDRFEKQVDPDGELPPDEREQRAEAAKKAHYQRMALKSAQARRAKGNGQ